MQFIRIQRRAGAILAIALAAIAMSASAASARVLDGPLHQTVQTSSAPPAPPYPDAPAPSPSPSPSVTVVHAQVAAPSGSFHWGDALIGAAVAGTIVLLITAGTLVVRRRTQLGEA